VENVDFRVSALITETERLELERAAAAEQRTMSSIMRLALRGRLSARERDGARPV
jgi:hypothetical protein